jgi:flagellar biosynthesis GTPase FlhF
MFKFDSAWKYLVKYPLTISLLSVSTGVIKAKKAKGVSRRSDVIDNTVTALIELQDRIEEREERRIKSAEEREERWRKEERDEEERRHRWEQEQEDRHLREHREFMLQIMHMRPQQQHFPNQGNEWGGPSNASL